MSRSGSVNLVRSINPDPVYGSKIITKLINYMMYDGKKDIASNIVYSVLDELEQDITTLYNEIHEIEGTPSIAREKVIIWFLEHILGKVVMLVEVKSRRIGGSNYRIPAPVPLRIATCRALKRIVNGARNRKDKTMTKKLSSELRDLIKGTGEAMRSKELAQKEVDSNRAFSHYTIR